MSCSKSYLDCNKGRIQTQSVGLKNLRLFLEHHAAFHKFKHYTNHLFIAKRMYESLISISICMFWGRKKDSGVDFRGAQSKLFLSIALE